MSKKTIRITESELKNIISNILNEIESGTWNNGSWVD
jgi:hypothetical protein